LLFRNPPGGIYLAIFPASPCLVFAIGKIGKNCQPLCGFPSCLKKNSANFIFFGKKGNPCLRQGFPLGGSSLRSKVMRGG
jgi:hypothetical protein